MQSCRPYKSHNQRCKDVLDFIKAYFDQKYTSPIYEEILSANGLKSRGHLQPIIETLIAAGELERQEGIARGLRLPGWAPPGLFSIPLKGSIAASNQNPLVVLDELDVHSTIEIPPGFIPPNTRLTDLYALTVHPDSMNDALIADGDTVIIRKGDSWKDGDIVAIWLNDEGAVTLKKLYQGRGDTLKLKPESHKHHARIENSSNVQVMGHMVAVLRKLDTH